MSFLVYGIIAYILGSIPTAVWVGKYFYQTDVREHGSKNAGATNTFRVLGKKPGIVVLFIDILKGIIAVSIPLWVNSSSLDYEMISNYQLVAAIAAVLGHVFPIFAQFKGGKGVATSLGIIIGIHPPAAALCLGIFLLTFVLSKYVSLGAIVAAFSFPILIEFVFNNDFFWLRLFSFALSLAVILTHHKNISRILQGTENKMNLFRKKP